MKETLKKILNKLKQFIPFKKMDPHNNWRNLLHFVFIIIILLIIFSFYLLYKIKNQKIFQVVPKSAQTEVLINEKLLEKVIGSFEEREFKEKEIKEGVNLYKDPS
jgi:hypothetical protein